MFIFVSLSHDGHMTMQSMTVTYSPFPQGVQTPHSCQSEAVVIGPQILFLLIGKVRLVPIMQRLVPLLLHTQVRLVPLEGVLQHSTCSICLLELVVDARMGTGRLGMGTAEETVGIETLAHTVFPNALLPPHTYTSTHTPPSPDQ